MGQIGIKMNILWAKESQWQFCKFQKTYFESSRQTLRFQSQKAYYISVPRTAGFVFKKTKVSFAKLRGRRY